MKAISTHTRKIIKRIVTAFLSVLIVLMAALVGYLTYCNVSGKVAYFGSYATVKIITPSMEPTIPTGSYIFAEKVAPEAVKEGDVIMFYSKDPQIYGKINTHRVVEVRFDGETYSYVTRGDRNPVNDAYTVSAEDLLGRYVKNADGLTAFAGFFSNPVVFFICVIIPAAVLVIVSMMDIVKKSKAARMEMLVEQEVRRLQENEQKQENAKNDEKEPTDDV